MSSNLPKYAYTQKGVVVMDNCICHDEAVKSIFGDIKILNKGFIELKNNEQGKLDFELHAIVSEGHINESCEKSPEIRKAIHDLLLCEENHSEYVLTFSRFVIFPKQFSHKDIADHLFYDFIIKGAGNVVFENVNGKPHAKAYGESIELDMKANKVDEEILNDGFHLS